MPSSVNGDTRVFLICGDPVEQVRAPEVFNLVFRTLAINAVLVPMHVTAQNIDAFVTTAFSAKNVAGLFVAIPHKALVMGLLAHCNADGRVAGAVNAVRRNPDGRLEGALFDGKGFVAALDYFSVAYAGKRVLLLGAGGGAAAIAARLAMAADQAPAEIALFDPVPGKAAAVASHIKTAAATQAKVRAAESSDPSGFDVVINASPLGLQPGDPLPCDVSRLGAHAAVIDILMKNQPTPLVRAARARGLVAEAGFEMLIQQTPDYLDFFGYSEAAQAVRQDATFIRSYLYPAAMAGEIRRRPAQPA